MKSCHFAPMAVPMDRRILSEPIALLSDQIGWSSRLDSLANLAHHGGELFVVRDAERSLFC